MPPLPGIDLGVKVLKEVKSMLAKGSFNGINKQFSCRIASCSFRIQRKQQMGQPVVSDHVRRHDLERPLCETFTCRIHYCGVRYSDRKYTDPLVPPRDVVPFSFRGQNTASALGLRESWQWLRLSARKANHGGLHEKKWRQLVLHEDAIASLSVRGRGAPQAGRIEGDKGLKWEPHRTSAARYPLDERGCGTHFFPRYSSFAII